MSNEYKLPCSCGQTVIVSARKSGETVHCECGKPLEVPTMRELRQLEPVPRQQPIAKPKWSVTQGLIFAVGTLMAVIAVGSALWLFSLLRRVDTKRPQVGHVDFEYDIDTFTISDTWKMWKQYSEVDLEDRPTPFHVLNRAYAAELRGWLAVNAVIGSLGMVAAAGAVLLWPRARGA